jgi:hypothetical protein
MFLCFVAPYVPTYIRVWRRRTYIRAGNAVYSELMIDTELSTLVNALYDTWWRREQLDGRGTAEDDHLRANEQALQTMIQEVAASRPFGADVFGPTKELIQAQSSERYAHTRHRLLGGLLDAARYGSLDPNWRDQLTSPAGVGDDALQPHVDVDTLALHELTTMPTQPWEPYAANGVWRLALNAWYRAALDLDNYRAHNDQLAVQSLWTARLQSRLQWVRSPHDDVLLAIQEVREQWSRQSNHHATQRYWTRWRDNTGASYRAGLAAGGDPDVNWTSWYRSRIETWDGECPAVSAADHLAALDEPQQYMEMLPEYWTQPKLADHHDRGPKLASHPG